MKLYDKFRLGITIERHCFLETNMAAWPGDSVSEDITSPNNKNIITNQFSININQSVLFGELGKSLEDVTLYEYKEKTVETNVTSQNKITADPIIDHQEGLPL